MSREPELLKDIHVQIFRWYDPVKKQDFYQADIFEREGEDHHGRGASPSEALLLAAEHWHSRAQAK